MSKLSKYTGVDFYQDYILPTNNASKNPLWKSLWKWSWKILKNDTVESLQERVNLAYKIGGMHTVLGILWAEIPAHGNVLVINILINLLCNIYPVFVQLKIRNRIVRILKHKAWRENKSMRPTGEEQLEEALRTDIQVLERMISS